MKPDTRTLFGLALADLSYAEILSTTSERSIAGSNTWIVTVNPEILLYAHQNADYHATLQNADMRVVDGFGAQLFSGVTHRITGVALTPRYLAYATEHTLPVLCIVRPDGLSTPSAIQEHLTQRYPGINLTVATPSDNLISIIQTIDPKIVLCSLGFPAQETTLKALQPHLHNAVSIGIGGTFDFLLGTKKRAPRMFQQLGIEWLWRLIQQPTRITRIWNAIIVFPLTLLFNKKNTRDHN